MSLRDKLRNIVVKWLALEEHTTEHVLGKFAAHITESTRALEERALAHLVANRAKVSEHVDAELKRFHEALRFTVTCSNCGRRYTIPMSPDAAIEQLCQCGRVLRIRRSVELVR